MAWHGMAWKGGIQIHVLHSPALRVKGWNGLALCWGGAFGCDGGWMDGCMMGFIFTLL